MIFSVEVKSHNVTDDNNERIKHGHMELLCKDQRKISFIMTNLEECNQLKDMIRQLTFLENLVPGGKERIAMIDISHCYFAMQMF